VLCIAAALLHPTTAIAQRQLSWGGSLAVTSDYVYRGLSQTEGRPAVQGAVHVRSESGWSTGILASTVNRAAGPSARSEIDLQLSKAWALSPDWNLLLSAHHYFYPDDSQAQPYEYDELVASLSYQNWLTTTVSWSPNTSRFSRDEFVSNRTARSYEVTALQPLTPALSLYGGVGHYDLQDLFDNGYWYWNAGISYCVGKLQMDLSHIDTDHTARRLFDYEVSKRRWAAALSWRF
jgi:uncharacterized protein (TIGR02001 family)